MAVFPAESPLSVAFNNQANDLVVTDELGLHTARVLALRSVPNE
jgi:hypothetical protein